MRICPYSNLERSVALHECLSLSMGLGIVTFISELCKFLCHFLAICSFRIYNYTSFCLWCLYRLHRVPALARMFVSSSLTLAFNIRLGHLDRGLAGRGP